jgi:DNA-directed RNA polymerase subunit M/transcription elongation factor TFIIS
MEEIGKKTLGLVLKQGQNIITFEKYIYSIAENEKEYKKILYDVCYKIKQGKNIRDILGNIKEGYVLWEDKEFEEFKVKQEEKDDFLTKPFEVEEGVNECKCGSKKTYSYTKQIRSSDEGTTVFCICVMCKNRWKMN